MNIFNVQFFVGLASSTISLSIPLLLGAEGEIFVERTGLFNMAIEGIMAISALSAFAAAFTFHSIIAGILASALTGGIIAAFLALLMLKVKADGIVIAIVFNIFATGFSGFLAKLFVNNDETTKIISKIANLPIPFLSRIPVVGEVLFSQNIMVYIAVLLVPVSHFVIFHTKFGLKIRAVGGNAKAATTMGINVFKIQFISFLIGGIMSGLAGGYLSLSLGMYAENMTQNKGFIALALCTFSRFNPYGALFGSVLFSLSDAIQLRLQAFGFKMPYEFLLMLPYLLTVIVLVIAAKKKFVNPIGYSN